MDREYFQFYKGQKMGIKTLEGYTIIPAIYDFVEPFFGGFFNVQEGDSTAYFDTNGKIALPFQNYYESYGNFSEGLARVRQNEKWGYIDITGQEIIELQFHFAEDFSSDIAIVRNSEGRHGAIDKTGKLIIDYQFPTLTKFENGYAKFGKHMSYGLIDSTGKIVVPQEYVYIGDVQNNKVTVQVREGENFKEGVLSIGGLVEWNDNLDKLNEFNIRKKQFVSMAENLIGSMYQEGCPCEYQRFRNFIQWDKPICFLDQEGIFSVFSKHLETTDNRSFKCKSCGTSYLQTSEEYSIVLQVMNIAITKRGDFTEKGAKVTSPIPVSLGFQGYNLDKLKRTHKQTDNETVMNYLMEKPDSNHPSSKAGRTWLQRLLGK